MSDVEECLSRRFAGNDRESRAIKNHTIQLWRTFTTHGFAKGNFIDRICHRSDVVFCQHYWEMLLAWHLIGIGFRPQRLLNGPDFRIEFGGRVVWIEAVAPEPGTGPDRVPDRFVPPIAFIKRQRELDPARPLEAFSVPDEQFILRWANAIRKKWYKWTTYLSEGIVSEADVYVIAVNGCNLGFAGLHGTEDYEIALRSVFPFGRVKVTWALETEDIVDVSHEHKSFIAKIKGENVPTNIFLDDAFCSVSALIATNTSPLSVPLGRPLFEFGVIHNPLAHVRLDVGTLGANVEFVPHEEADGYCLEIVRP